MNDYYTDDGRVDESPTKQQLIASVEAQVANLLSKTDNWDIMCIDNLLPGTKKSVSFSVDFHRTTNTIKTKVKITIPLSHTDEDSEETAIDDSPLCEGEGGMP